MISKISCQCQCLLAVAVSVKDVVLFFSENILDIHIVRERERERERERYSNLKLTSVIHCYTNDKKLSSLFIFSFLNLICNRAFYTC